MIKTVYRPSFDFVARGSVIHVVPQDSTQTACGLDAKECRQIYDIVRQTDESSPVGTRIQDAKYCKKCREAYHLRPEAKFPPIK